jgi:molybdopterin synthase sulfur carrier subunit
VPASGATVAPLTVLYFAWLRERVGVAEEAVTPPAEVRDVAGLIAWLTTRGPGDEVAFFPPVTGG